MTSSTMRVGRLAGIPVGVHPLWLVIVALITLALGENYFPAEAPGIAPAAAYALGLASALALFAGVLAHELGHAVVARRHGIEVDEIDLWLLGGVARISGEARAPADELRFAAAGPAVTAALLVVFGAIDLALANGSPDWLRAFVGYQLYVNAAILVLNLLPAFPLDGGRIARSLLWRRTGDRDRATDTAAGIGRAFGFGMVILGVFSFLGGAVGGLWLALIGGFLVMAAGAEAQASHLAQTFAGTTVGELMSTPVSVLGAELTAAEAVSSGFAHHLFSAFPVVDDEGRAIGLVTIGDVRALTPAARARTRLCDIARRDAGLRVPPDTPVAGLLTSPAFARTGRAVVVDAAGRPVGLLSITDADRRLRADALLDASQRHAA